MQAGRLIGERFVVESLAGQGGMGLVYRARDVVTGEPVAIKLIREVTPRAALRFAREAEALAELRHPGIVRYLGDGTTDLGEHYLAMEWLVGESLADRLRRGPLSLPQALGLIGRVGEALAAAHARGMVHRDIKPSNLWLRDGDPARPALLDFGVVRLPAQQQQMTSSGAIVGTAGYMAPEQARGEVDVGPRADVFSMGCVLFESVAGRPPFTGATPQAVLMKIVLDDPPRLADLVPGTSLVVDELVARMLAKAADDRPRDGAMVAVFADAAAATPEPADGPPAPRLTGAERKLFAIVLSAAAVVGDEARSQHVHGPRTRTLRDGSLLVHLEATGAATDLALRSAREALTLRARLPGSPIALAIGNERAGEGQTAGAAMDRAAALLLDAPEGAVCLDQIAAGLLDGRFVIERVGDHVMLGEEIEPGNVGRHLLGRMTRFVGREREVSALEAAVSASAGEPAAHVVLVTGPAGIGKSRLRQELTSRQRVHGETAALWFAAAGAVGAGAALGLVRQIVRAAAGMHQGDILPLRRARLRAHTERLLAPEDACRVADFLGELCGTPFSDGGSLLLRAARRDAALLGDQMLRAWTDWLSAECAARPVILILEDLHWGDLASIRFIDAALRALGEMPLCVVAFARPEVHERFPRLWSGQAFQEIRLRPLPRRAAQDLVRDALGRLAGDDTTDRLVNRAAGNAFFLEELIRATAQGRGEAFPDTILAMVQARLEAMPEVARRAIRAASIVGDVFWDGVLLELVGDAAGLAELEADELITRRRESRFPGQAEYAFRHEMVREAAYGTLLEHDCRLGHRLAAGWLESMGDPDPQAVAEHFELGGEPAQAVFWHLRAAELAMSASDLDTAIVRAERGLAGGASGETRARLHALAAEVQMWRGRYERGAVLAQAAMADAQRGSSTWYEAAATAATCLGRLSRFDELVTMSEGLTEAPASTALPAFAAALAQAVNQLVHGGRDRHATALRHLAARELAPVDAQEPFVRAHWYLMETARALGAADFGAALSPLERAAADLTAIGNLRRAIMTQQNLAFSRVQLGDYTAAEQGLRAVIEVAAQMGNRHVLYTAKQNLALALVKAGRGLDEAGALAAESAAAFHDFPDARHEALSLGYRALSHLCSDQLEDAERFARASLAVAAPIPPTRGAALAILAAVLLRAGRADEALAMAREGMEILDTLGSIEEHVELLRLAHAEALAASGDLAGARSALATAWAVLQETAARLEPALRKSYLERVPENARTRELASRVMAPSS